MSRFFPRSLAFGAAISLLAGVSFAGVSVMEAAARSAGPAAAQSTMTENDSSDVAGAAVDLADAEQWLAELEGGNFANIFVIENDGSMRCGEVKANSACKPLTEADKAGAIAEAREAVEFATAAVEDAEKSFAANGAGDGIQAVGFAR